jgi:K+-transporting ATPase KdpF subunit
LSSRAVDRTSASIELAAAPAKPGIFSSPRLHGRRATFQPCSQPGDAASAAVALIRFGEVGRGHRIHSRHRGALRELALDHLGDLAPRGRAMSAAYVVGGLLALGLCVYLLYAMFKPEKF